MLYSIRALLTDVIVTAICMCAKQSLGNFPFHVSADVSTIQVLYTLSQYVGSDAVLRYHMAVVY